MVTQEAPTQARFEYPMRDWMRMRAQGGWVFLVLVLAVATGLVLIAVTQRRYKEEDAALFLLGMLFLPIVLLFFSRQDLAKRLGGVVVATAYWLWFYAVYVGYQNHPWFDQQPVAGCDGPCSGWYSFENPPIFGPLIGVAFISSAVGTSILLAIMWIKAKRQRTTIA